MQYVNSIYAAMRATAPVVAIPVEGHAPVILSRKVLKGALKRVTITSVQLVLNQDRNCRRVLVVRGYCGYVRTCSRFYAMERNQALPILWKWTDRMVAKRQKEIMQGATSTEAIRAAKLAQFEREAA